MVQEQLQTVFCLKQSRICLTIRKQGSNSRLVGIGHASGIFESIRRIVLEMFDPDCEGLEILREPFAIVSGLPAGGSDPPVVMCLRPFPPQPARSRRWSCGPCQFAGITKEVQSLRPVFVFLQRFPNFVD
jgi:hypothetical protein